MLSQKCETNPIPAHFEIATLPEGQSRRAGEPNFPPRPKYETNPICPYRWLPHSAKRTQFPARRTKYGTSAHGGLRTKDYMLNAVFNETNPITSSLLLYSPSPLLHFCPYHPPLCKTVPIYEPPTTNYEPKMQNEPNPRRGPQSTNYQPPTTNKIRKTNPIIPARSPKSPHTGKPRTTNHELRTLLCETNPICPPRPPHRPNAQNKPNLPSRRTKNAKRTQFPYAQASAKCCLLK